jgi:hypothetical protein
MSLFEIESNKNNFYFMLQSGYNAGFQTGFGAGTQGFNNAFVGGGLDVDPITPGVQNQRGVLTATGPSVIVPMGPGDFGYGTGGLGGYDADPITPGNQSQPGIVIPTGPSRVISGPGTYGATNSMLASGYRGASGVGISAGNGGVFGGSFGVDVDPITPGIQTQPGTLTATGPSQFVSPGSGSGMLNSGTFGGGRLGSYDADPITPGIQSQPGFVTVTGPSQVVSQGAGIGFGVGTGIGGSVIRRSVIDADPITPGIQSQPGIVTPIGPSTVVSQGAGFGVGSGVFGPRSVYGAQRSCTCCPWWLWTLLGLALLVGLISGLYAFNHQKRDVNLK